MNKIEVQMASTQEGLFPQNTNSVKTTLTTTEFDQQFMTQDAISRDAAIHARIMNGDTEAFAELWENYQALVIKNCKLMFHNNHDDAIDAHDEIRMKAFISIGTFNPTYSFVPWIKTITRNYCLNIITHNTKYGILYIDTDAEQDAENMSAVAQKFINTPDTTFLSPFASAAAHEEAETIQKCLSKLSQSHAEVITLRFFEGYKYEEIAKALDLPIGTIMSRIYNAREKFREAWKTVTGTDYEFENTFDYTPD
jgi:RNA polymerase sigma-70 factor (ECF subfamily)